ncbi:unnamed protein product [Leptosia nina]|uniref:Uncharacterized protein n=1 Tax=Leptosia nina TaxID=320188 RepID=A0AAV1JDR8_9NEOP
MEKRGRAAPRTRPTEESGRRKNEGDEKLERDGKVGEKRKISPPKPPPGRQPAATRALRTRTHAWRHAIYEP